MPSPSSAPAAATAPLILFLDTDGRISGASAGLLTLGGWRMRSLLAQPHGSLLQADQPPAATAALGQALRAGRPWCGRLAYRDAEGRPLWLQVQAVPQHVGSRCRGHLLLHSALGGPEGHPAGHAPDEASDRGLAAPLVLGVGGLSGLAMVSGLLTGLAGPALLLHLGACGLGGAALLAWLQARLVRPWRHAQQQAGLTLQALLDELGPQVEALCSAGHALADDTDDLGQRTELAAAALQEVALTLEQWCAALQQPGEPPQTAAAQLLGLSHLCEAMTRLDDDTQHNAGRADACKSAAAALAGRADRLAASMRLFQPPHE